MYSFSFLYFFHYQLSFDLSLYFYFIPFFIIKFLKKNLLNLLCLSVFWNFLCRYLRSKGIYSMLYSVRPYVQLSFLMKYFFCSCFEYCYHVSSCECYLKFPMESFFPLSYFFVWIIIIYNMIMHIQWYLPINGSWNSFLLRLVRYIHKFLSCSMFLSKKSKQEILWNSYIQITYK